MLDTYGREINYLRVSITDRCNLRCVYCMPDGFKALTHDDVMRYEEILRVCAAAIPLGITRFKVTGGEPFARRGALDFIARLKQLSGVQRVTTTTNGLLLDPPSLKKIGADGVNISLDAIDGALYRRITGSGEVGVVLEKIRQCAALDLRTKINCVLLKSNVDQILPLCDLARLMSVDVRFIEFMPMGQSEGGVSCGEALAVLRREFPDLAPTKEGRGSGPAVYYKSTALLGRIGFIGAVSRSFCTNCNRMRLTAAGYLKPCLCYGEGTDLREILRNSGSDAALTEAISAAIRAKPREHCFAKPQNITERHGMYQIGG